MTIILNPSDADQLIAHARREFPNECCGVLLGRTCGENCRIERIVPASNVAEGDHRRNYQIDWPTLFRVVRAARTGAPQIVGFYHSHPDGSTRPSRRDWQAAWIDHAYLIVSTDGAGHAELSCWRVPTAHAEFQAETLEIRAIPLGSPSGGIEISPAILAGTSSTL